MLNVPPAAIASHVAWHGFQQLEWAQAAAAQSTGVDRLCATHCARGRFELLEPAASLRSLRVGCMLDARIERERTMTPARRCRGVSQRSRSTRIRRRRSKTRKTSSRSHRKTQARSRKSPAFGPGSGKPQV
jgi:hypothetical protein